jgi:hypothetical protein
MQMESMGGAWRRRRQKLKHALFERKKKNALRGSWNWNSLVVKTETYKEGQALYQGMTRRA